MITRGQEQITVLIHSQTRGGGRQNGSYEEKRYKGMSGRCYVGVGVLKGKLLGGEI